MNKNTLYHSLRRMRAMEEVYAALKRPYFQEMEWKEITFLICANSFYLK